MGDALAPGLALGQAVGRLGCLLQGCCHGRTAPAWFPMALRFPDGAQAPAHVPLYPTQPAEAAALALLAVWLLAHLKKRPRRPGRTLALYLALSGLTRLVMEFFRGDDRGRLLGLPPTTLAAAAALAVGLWAWWRLGRPRQSPAGDPGTPSAEA
jgi:phosphatidylglycerol:prolipoprotein diacylglycerol transferase